MTKREAKELLDAVEKAALVHHYLCTHNKIRRLCVLDIQSMAYDVWSVLSNALIDVEDN